MSSIVIIEKEYVLNYDVCRYENVCAVPFENVSIDKVLEISQRDICRKVKSDLMDIAIEESDNINFFRKLMKFYEDISSNVAMVTIGVDRSKNGRYVVSYGTGGYRVEYSTNVIELRN